MPTNATKVSEANVQRAICDLLTAKKILWFRMNAGNQFGSYTKKDGSVSKWCKLGQRAGTADLLAFYRLPDAFWPASVWIEVKAPGKKQSPGQVEFQREVTKYGCSYLLADNVDTVIEWLKARGL